MNSNQLRKLAELVWQRNLIEKQVSHITGTPAEIGPVGEFIASQVFDIELHERRNAKGDDGAFRSGPLAGKGVNIKWYSKHAGLLDINPDAVPDYYLVLVGPKADATSTHTNPWSINEAYLFDGPAVVEALTGRGRAVGVASSLLQEEWRAAMIYPVAQNPQYACTEEQKAALGMFQDLCRSEGV